MGWTKRDLVQEAFNECALQGYVFNVGPDELEGALRRLDTMMATWTTKNIELGYALPENPDSSDLGDASGLPLAACEAVYLNLALRISAGFGKTPAPATMVTAKNAYDTLLIAAAQPGARTINPLPAGAGNKPWRTSALFLDAVADA